MATKKVKSRRALLLPVFVAGMLASRPEPIRGQLPVVRCDAMTQYGLPQWFTSWFESSSARTQYDLSCYLNPFYLRGNFDGRGQPDLAVLVVQRSSGKRGVLVVHRPGLAFFVLGAGTAVGNGGDDFSWLDVWTVDAAPRSDGGLPLAGFVGEVLDLIKEDSASGWVGWNGRKYVWVQGSD